MAEVLLSCEMLEDEMQLALQRTGAQLPIVWMDAGLHEYPDKLRAALREKIAELEQDYDTILLGFCLCGNAMDGVGASRARLIVPRFDDCIRMLMSRTQGQLPDVDCHCLYFTHSWTTHGKFLTTQYDETINTAWREAVRAYTAGTMTRDEAISSFKTAVGDKLDIIVK